MYSIVHTHGILTSCWKTFFFKIHHQLIEKLKPFYTIFDKIHICYNFLFLNSTTLAHYYTYFQIKDMHFTVSTLYNIYPWVKTSIQMLSFWSLKRSVIYIFPNLDFFNNIMAMDCEKYLLPRLVACCLGFYKLVYFNHFQAITVIALGPVFRKSN